REDFEWIRSEIVALGGEATLFAVDESDHGGQEDLVSTFRHTRDTDYKRLKRDADQLLASARRKKTSADAGDDGRRRGARRLPERFNDIERIDFFGAPARQQAAESLAALERAVAHDKPSAPPDVPHLAISDFRRRRWVTRPRPGVDRMSTAWLIRRF